MIKVSLTEVARKLNLSKTTVSRVFNNAPASGISVSTRHRVWNAIKELGYEPNLSARALARGKTHVIGVMMVNINNPFVGGFVSSVESAARAAGYHVILCNSHGNIEREYEEIGMLRQRGVEGLIIEHRGDPDPLVKLAKEKYPFVLLDRCPEAPWIDYVTFDDEEGGRMATQTLIDAGCNRVAHLAGPETIVTARDRLAGYRKALTESGLAVREDWVVTTERIEDHRSGGQAAGTLLDLPDRPDGIFCFDDYLAIGVYQAARERELKVPDDLAVIGYNDFLFCPWLAVPLASVRLDMEELGRKAGTLLLDKIEQGDGDPRSIRVLPQVVHRESLGTKPW